VLAKKRRLPIPEVLRKKPAYTVRGRFFLLKFFPSTALESRWGALVSKGVAKKAADRNALRRRMLRIAAAEAKRIAHGDVLLISQAPALAASAKEAEEELFKLCAEFERWYRTHTHTT
jgi:ribonuclease P protein component